MIDCQQNTRHLASLGAGEIPRDGFCRDRCSTARRSRAPPWHFEPYTGTNSLMPPTSRT